MMMEKIWDLLLKIEDENDLERIFWFIERMVAGQKNKG